MKRISNVYDQIISIKNLKLAHKNACKGKSKQKGVITFKKKLNANIEALHEELKACNYKNPEYQVFTIYEPKERKIFVLPYRDRIIHHAILQIIGDMFVKNLTKDSYSCIKLRGIHCAKRNVEKALKDKVRSRYCLKIDVTQFYPSVDREILKSLLLRKIKDQRLLKLLFEIIDSAEGLPIGNYLSQYLGNFYLSPLDHYIKEELKAWFMARYCDDIIIFSDNKSYLHEILHKMRVFLWDRLKLKVKGNYQIFPIASRALDFVGYVMDHDKTLIRKSIKKNFIKMVKHNPNKESIASYNGWLLHANTVNLKRKVLSK